MDWYIQASGRRSVGRGAADVGTAPLSGESKAWETPPDEPGSSGGVRPRARRAWEALAWAAGAAGLLLVLLRVSMTVSPPADAASPCSGTWRPLPTDLQSSPANTAPAKLARQKNSIIG